jgi:iron complex outermembrane recepter protein
MTRTSFSSIRKIESRLVLGIACAAIVAPAALAIEAQSGADNQLNEIVVTANKRDESIADVSSTVNVLTGAQLDQLNASSFQDFVNFVPSMTSLSGGLGENEISLRGVTSGGYPSASVAIYLDETPIGSSTAFAFGSNALDSNVYDLQRLEVLSGPQGTLYGASTLGGLVKYVTRSPDLGSFEEEFDGDLSHTENGALSHNERAVINAPIIKDVLAVRVVGYAQTDAGYVDDPIRNMSRVDYATLNGGRITLLDQITPDMSLKLMAMTQRIDRNGATEVSRSTLTLEPIQGPYDQSTLASQPYIQTFTLYSGLFSWNMPWASLTSNSSLQNIGSRNTIDDTSTFGPILGTGLAVPFTTTNKGQTRKFTEELRLTSAVGKIFDWQLGGYYTHETSTGTTVLTDLSSPDGTFSGLPLYNGETPTTYEEGAVFGDLTLHITPKADLTLGTRYSRDEQGYTQITQGLFSQPSDPFATIQRSADSNESVSTYLVNPRYHLTPDEMLYARFATGYRPGGPNLTPYDAEGHPVGNGNFDPDTVHTYEVGLKSAFLERRATLDFDVYYIDWRDIQLVGIEEGLEQLENGGTASILGAEMTAGYVIGGLTLGASLAYIDGKLTQDAPKLDATDGERLPLSSKWAGALVADYRYPIAAAVSGTIGFSDRFVGQRNAGFNGSDVEPQFSLGSYNVFDLRAGATLSQYTVNFFAKNVFNRLGFVSAGISTSDPTLPAMVTLTQPRTVGLEFKARFKQ